MTDFSRDFWIRETGTGQQVATLHDRYMMMMNYMFSTLHVCSGFIPHFFRSKLIWCSYILNYIYKCHSKLFSGISFLSIIAKFLP